VLLRKTNQQETCSIRFPTHCRPIGNVVLEKNVQGIWRAIVWPPPCFTTTDLKQQQLLKTGDTDLWISSGNVALNMSVCRADFTGMPGESTNFRISASNPMSSIRSASSRIRYCTAHKSTWKATRARPTSINLTLYRTLVSWYRPKIGTSCGLYKIYRCIAVATGSFRCIPVATRNTHGILLLGRFDWCFIH